MVIIDLTEDHGGDEVHLFDTGGRVDEVTVEGSVIPELNSVYLRNGQHGFVSKYTKPGLYNGQQVTIFRATLSYNKLWLISGVDENSEAETVGDTDYYSVSLSPQSQSYYNYSDPNIPPKHGWTATHTTTDIGGSGNPPRVSPTLINLAVEPVGIEGFPLLTFEPGNPHSTCSICLDEFKDEEIHVAFHCLHNFHRRCIDELIRTNKNNKNVQCPTCRTVHGVVGS